MSKNKEKEENVQPGRSLPVQSIRKSTFEELENENRLYSLSLSPVERFAYLMELNINAFGRKSLLIKLDKHIYKK